MSAGSWVTLGAGVFTGVGLLGVLLKACDENSIPVTVEGVVWEDRNANGLRDEGEPGVVGVDVQLFCGLTQSFAPSVEETSDFAPCRATTTDTSGRYVFDGVYDEHEATYALVQFNPAPGATFTAPRSQQAQQEGTRSHVDPATGRSNPELLFRDSAITVNAGLVPTTPTAPGTAGPTTTAAPPSAAPAADDTVPDTSPPVSAAPPPPATGAIGGVYWKDLDGDGLHDPEEARETAELEGFTVSLLDEAGNPLAETTVDEQGRYQFAGLAAGRYWVQFPLPDNGRFEFTVRDAGDDTLDSDVDPASGEAEVTLAAGVTNATIGAGIHFTG